MADDFLLHFGVKGMKWGKRKASSDSAGSEKTPSAGKQRDLDIKAARARINEGKPLVRRLLNADTFGKPLGGHRMLSLMNPSSSKEDLALAASMTRGQKVALSTVGGVAATMFIAGKLLR